VSQIKLNKLYLIVTAEKRYPRGDGGIAQEAQIQRNTMAKGVGPLEGNRGRGTLPAAAQEVAAGQRRRSRSTKCSRTTSHSRSSRRSRSTKCSRTTSHSRKHDLNIIDESEGSKNSSDLPTPASSTVVDIQDSSTNLQSQSFAEVPKDAATCKFIFCIKDYIYILCNYNLFASNVSETSFCLI
jgi:hypothetical protein